MPRALILCPQRRSMVIVVMPITTVASAPKCRPAAAGAGCRACHGAGRPHGPVEHAMVDREVGLVLPPKNTQRRRDSTLPAPGTAPATNSRMFCQVGRVNRLGQVGQPLQ